MVIEDELTLLTQVRRLLRADVDLIGRIAHPVRPASSGLLRRDHWPTVRIPPSVWYVALRVGDFHELVRVVVRITREQIVGVEQGVYAVALIRPEHEAAEIGERLVHGSPRCVAVDVRVAESP